MWLVEKTGIPEKVNAVHYFRLPYGVQYVKETGFFSDASEKILGGKRCFPSATPILQETGNVVSVL